MAEPAADINPDAVAKIIRQTGSKPEHTIAILNAIQDTFHYLPRAALRQVCELTEISPARLAGAASFYTRFRHRPSGLHRIKVCIGTACHVKGAEAVFNAFRQFLEIREEADTDAAGLFTVEKVACLGCCMLAPAVQIGSLVYGYLHTRKIPAVLRDFLNAQSQPALPAAGAAGAASRAAGEVRICTCSSCQAAGAGKVYRELLAAANRQKLPVRITSVGCTGLSGEAPLVTVITPSGETINYGRIQPAAAAALLHSHFRPAGWLGRTAAAARRLLEKIYAGSPDDTLTRYRLDTRDTQLYLQPGLRLATRYGGELDPLNLAEYQSRDGFRAFRQLLAAGDREEVFRQLAQSRLRGRGGAGFSTAEKWRTVAKIPGSTRYIVCNGDEGDPGAFMDRMILESFPFRVIEGMLIAAYTLQAAEGFLYIRSEYPLAVGRLKQAIELAMQHNLLGSRILGTAFNFRLQVVEGAGAFVCGEETALIAALEGRRGIPVYKPPYPAEKGLWNQPTLVNNVETFALVPWILLHGGSAFAATGTRGSTGTKTFALAGKINRGGLVEVPMGLSLRQIIYDIGGGIQQGRTLKAVQVGGPSGGCIPAALADTPVDFDALTAAGAIMGSGGMVVLDETDCMVDLARYFMSFTQAESCGKCTYCRIGTRRMLEILDRITDGTGRPDDLEKLEQLAGMIRQRSVCGLGRTAPNPVLSTLRWFRGEYEAHLAGHCPAKRCKALIRYRIGEKCIGCTKCAQACPAGAIRGEPFSRHEIDPRLCVRCDTCRMVCPETAVEIV